jgi:hypothetical protein
LLSTAPMVTPLKKARQLWKKISPNKSYHSPVLGAADPSRLAAPTFF